MEKSKILNILENVASGKIDPKMALSEFVNFPSMELGYACLDQHRSLREGFPEVIFCQGKTRSQVMEIFCELSQNYDNVLATRATLENYQDISAIIPDAEYNEIGRVVFLNRFASEKIGSALIVSAGTADLPVAEEAAACLKTMGANVETVYDVGVAGLHRIIDVIPRLEEVQVVIVVAGMEGALASVIGGLTSKPVIAIPTSIGYGASFGGIAALLTMLNSCASGVGVVNIDNGYGAAALAHAILRR